MTNSSAVGWASSTAASILRSTNYTFCFPLPIRVNLATKHVFSYPFWSHEDKLLTPLLYQNAPQHKHKLVNSDPLGFQYGNPNDTTATGERKHKSDFFALLLCSSSSRHPSRVFNAPYWPTWFQAVASILPLTTVHPPTTLQCCERNMILMEKVSKVFVWMVCVSRVASYSERSKNGHVLSGVYMAVGGRQIRRVCACLRRSAKVSSFIMHAALCKTGGTYI